jgi:hypothetical protein
MRLPEQRTSASQTAVLDIAVHPQADVPQLRNDVALLRLAGPIPRQPAILPAVEGTDPRSDRLWIRAIRCT